MKSRSPFGLAILALVLALGCGDDRQLTGPRAHSRLFEIISDGAHGGNPDFFFLPPLVKSPKHTDDYDKKKSINALGPFLTVEICELTREPLTAEGVPGFPTEDSECVAGPLLKKFGPGTGAGTVQLELRPYEHIGWWNPHHMPKDGFYYVMWKPAESELKLDTFYRIKVFLDGADKPLGFADVDPVSSKREFRHSRTGETIPLINGNELPIPFRIESGALCRGATLCTSATVTRVAADGSGRQILRVAGPDGVPIGGVLLPDKWLPEGPGRPQSVVFTIARVNTGVNNVADGTQQFECHADLELQQFDGCFHYSTIPELVPIDTETGRMFPVGFEPTAGVCFVLNDTNDPREAYVQLWSSEPDKEGDTKPLKSADASAILTDPAGENCGTQPVIIGSNSTNPLTRLAGLGWHKLTRGVGRVFGVKTAYAVNLGLGGVLPDISNVGPALTAEIRRHTNTGLSLGPGATTTSTARIVGTQVHDGGPLTTGIGGLPVTFTASGGSTLRLLGSEAAPAPSVTVLTNFQPINGESPVSGGGFAPVNWTMPTPTTPGTYTYTLTADGPALGAPVTFTSIVTVASAVIGFESYPVGESPACGGEVAQCPVTDEFASVGVIFRFVSAIEGGGTTATLCRRPFRPAGEAVGFTVSPFGSGTTCSGWQTGTVTMSFASKPTVVEFQVDGNALGGGSFPVNAVDGNGNPVTVTRESFSTYIVGQFTYRREIRRATSANGIASIAVASPSTIAFIDNLSITP